MEFFDGLTWLRGVIVAVLAVAAVFAVVIKEREVHRTARMRALVLGAIASAVGLVAFVAWRVIAPLPAYGVVELSPGDAPARITVGEGPALLLVHGRLGADGNAQGEGRYGVVVQMGTTEVGRFSGTLKQSVKTQKFMRRGRMNTAIAHLEGRHVLAPTVRNADVAIAVTESSGQLHGPLHVEVIPAPPPERGLVFLFLLLAIAGAVADATTRAAKTYVGFAVPMVGMLTVLLLEAPHPLTVSHLARSIPVAFLGGLIVGGVLRGLSRLVAKRIRQRA